MIQKKPKISIIIPTYQHADDISACLKSIFGQTFTDFEVIVVDDGSTDNTQDVLKPYLDRITSIVQENRGGNAARNRGFKEAKGDYLLFCDADLILDQFCLEKMIAKLEASPKASYVYTAFKFGWKTFKFWDFDADTLRRINYIHTSSLIRREHFPGFDETIRKFQDWDLWLTMLEAGHVGVYLPEVLFKAIPHEGGISLWVPRFFYKVPWKKFRWRVMSVEKYKQAREIIRQKHTLENTPTDGEIVWKMFWRVLGLLTLFELISFAGYIWPQFNELAFVIGMIGVSVLAWRSFQIAILVLLADLFVGSQGGAMLSLGIGSGLSLSWRMGLFLVIGTVFVAKNSIALLRRDKSELSWFKELSDTKILWPYITLILAIVYAIIRGIMIGNGASEVFFDANGYLYFLLLPPLLSAYLSDKKNMLLRIRAVLLGGMTMASIKALAVLYIFSHRRQELMVQVYKWIRDTRVGEITIIRDTDFYRVFFQSHLFAAMLFLGILLWMATVATRREGGLRRNALLLGVMMSSIVLGLSRSYWVGMFLGAITGVGLLIWTKAPRQIWQRIITYGIVSMAIGIFLVVAAYALPIPARTGDFSVLSLLSDRATSLSGEAAVDSRWSLLPEVTKAALEHPILGSGFGYAVTYITKDPRILAYIPSGVYSTIAFEWGYHDMWIKLGLVGLLAYFWFLVSIIRPHIETLRIYKDSLVSGGLYSDRRMFVRSAIILIAVVVLLGTHIFSPYLNHPLGIGSLLLVATLVSSSYTDKKRL